MRGLTRTHGYAMAALLVALSVMAVMLSIAMPVWQTLVRREREAELVFRGEQYMLAIDLYSRRTGGYPTSLDALRTGRYIRQLYKDPITGEDFRPVFFGQVTMPAPGTAQAGQRGGGPPGAQPGSFPGSGITPTPAGRGVQVPQATGPATRAGRAGFSQTGPGATAGAAGPIIGVVSTSTDESLRLYNGRSHYNEWLFVATAATQQPGIPAGSGPPGMRGGAPPAPGRRGAGPGTSPTGPQPLFNRGASPPGMQRPGMPPPGMPPTGGSSTRPLP